MTDACEFCGDPATEHCSRKHRDWTIVRPYELKKDDVILRFDGKLYQVLKVRHKTDTHFSDPDVFVVETGQREVFTLRFARLPILVKRETVCGWPTCGLHCAKCARYAEVEENRARLLGLQKPEKSSRRRVPHPDKEKTVVPIRERIEA